MEWIIGGGGGYSAPTPRKRHRNVEAEICRRLGLPFYGFLLYHSGHKRIKYFLENHANFLDQVTGANFGIFLLANLKKTPLKIDEILSKESVEEDIKSKIREWRKTTAPFSVNKCFEIAEALKIPRTDLPCLIVYRSANGYRPFARLKLNDAWFPESEKDEKTLKRSMEWQSKLFDSLQWSMKNKRKKDAIKAFQKEMDKLGRSLNVYQPIFKGLKDSLVPVVKLPFDIVASLSSIVRKVGTKMVRKKLEAVLENED